MTVPISGGASELVGPMPYTAADCSPPSEVTPGLGKVAMLFQPSEKERERDGFLGSFVWNVADSSG